jgi:regulator of sigma E protease
MEILVKILQLLLSLSILVLFHEMGHFIAAKLFKTRVEKFYLFFNPWFSIFKWKKGETEYGMGWLPLGGYVKISGMIDESMDKEQMKLPPQPYEFRSKPAWQRLIIMIGGVSVNILLAIAIYIVMLTVWGEQYLPTKEANKYGITCDSLALEMGLKNGDKLLSVDNETFENFLSFPLEILLNEAKTVQVERDNKAIDINIPEGFLQKLVSKKTADFVFVRFPYEAHSFSENSAAEAAGMQINDRIIEINNVSAHYFNELSTEIQKYKNEEVGITVVRENDTLILNVLIPEESYIGVYAKPITNYFTFSDKRYGFIEAIPAGFAKTYKSIGDYLKQLRLMFSPEVKAYKQVGSFITIASIFPGTWDWESFWQLTAFLSIMLAVINLLPIPALDGGHTMFLLYEIIARRKPSDKFMEYSQVVGMILLLALMVFAIGNDFLMHVF